MYFSYYENKYCVNCDWLQFSVLLSEEEPEIICPEGLRIELCQGNNIFEHRALVYDSRGAKYLTLLWKPFSKVLPRNLMTVQVANEFLYFGGQGVKWAWKDVQGVVDCTFNAIGRVDICIDFQGSDYVSEFLKHLNSHNYYVQAKSEGSVWWHEVSNGMATSKQLHCMAWGSPKSEIKVKVYHKSREQGLLNGNEADKPWILKDWQAVGFDIHNVWRLEFSLNGAGQLRWKKEPITLDMVSDDYWLLDVICQLYDTRFVTRRNQGRRSGHKNEDARVWLFQLPKRAQGLKWADNKGKDYECPASITLLRAMMRQVDNPAIMSNKPTFTDYANTILNIIDNHRLHGYFVRTWEKDPKEYFNELWQYVGEGVQKTAPPPRKLMD